MEQYKKLVENFERGHFWPGIDVDPKLLELPSEVRHNTKIAQLAWEKALPQIKKDLLELSNSKQRNVRNYFKCSERALDEKLRKIGDVLLFEAQPKSSHLISARFGAHISVFVPRADVLPDLARGKDRWYAKNVADNPLYSLVFTRWILAYHELLETIEKKR